MEVNMESRHSYSRNRRRWVSKRTDSRRLSTDNLQTRMDSRNHNLDNNLYKDNKLDRRSSSMGNRMPVLVLASPKLSTGKRRRLMVDSNNNNSHFTGSRNSLRSGSRLSNNNLRSGSRLSNNNLRSGSRLSNNNLRSGSRLSNNNNSH
jgi:hypothetical protein